jgi:murein L,D-transpeptidase YafK
MLKRFVMLAGVSLALAACQDPRQQSVTSTRHLAPIPPATMALMSAKGLSKNDPILIRAYKKESEMEVWKRGPDGKYAHLKTFPICRWSGQLGPKRKEGDRQAPEGFYTITPGLMNPNSSYYLSFDTGYPNAYDRAQGGTGAHLMVHGTCSSAGCFAMTDESIAEIYAIAREAFAGGQRGFQFQSYPFRMTAENLAKHRLDPNMPFWRNLKEGSDHFEALKEEPKVAVCGRRYVFGGSDVAQGSCSPKLDPAVAEKREADESQVAALIAKGAPAVRTVYADGAQHQSFRETQVADGGDAGRNFSLFAQPQPRRNLGEVSRPEALAQGPQEILMDEPAPKTGKVKPSTALALAAAQKVMAAKSAGAKGAAKPASSGSAARTPKPDAVVVASAGDDAPVGSVRRMPGSGQPPAAVEPASRHKRPATAQAKPASKPGVTTVPKPDAVLAGPERRAEAPGGLIHGAQPVLPSATGFARAN